MHFSTMCLLQLGLSLQESSLLRIAGFCLNRLRERSLRTYHFVSRPSGSLRSTIRCKAPQWVWSHHMYSGYKMSSSLRSRTESRPELTCSSSEGNFSGQTANKQGGRGSNNEMPLVTLVKGEMVDFDKLSAEEREIYRLHQEACQAGEASYTDPSTGYVVLTQNYHLARGKCCGSACRHCPYGHANVPEEFRTKTFNSAFFI